MTRCPSDLALEAHFLAPERSRLKLHLDACEACRGRVARMQAEGEEFRRYVFPATVDAVREAAGSRRARWATLVAPAAALAAVAVAAVLVVRTGPAGPGPDYVGAKGGAPAARRVGRAGLTVFVQDEGGARAVEDGAVVPAGAALRFKVSPDDAHCWLWILSVDGTGQISRLYPPKGMPVADRAAGPVPGGAVLDGQPGPERLFAVCADSAATTWDDVRRAAAPATGGPDAVRRARLLGEPLAGECQSTLLVEKRR